MRGLLPALVTAGVLGGAAVFFADSMPVIAIVLAVGAVAVFVLAARRKAHTGARAGARAGGCGAVSPGGCGAQGGCGCDQPHLTSRQGPIQGPVRSRS